MNMFQMKQWEKNPDGQLSEVEIGNLLGKKIRLMIVTIIHDLGNSRGTHREDIRNI